MQKFLNNDKSRWGITLALGMLVVLWRVVLPINFGITFVTGLIILLLDLVLTAALVLINKNELKEAFLKKFTKKELLIITAGFVALLVGQLATNVVMALLDNFGIIAYSEPPAALVSNQLSEVFFPPLGATISIVFLAPIWEEIAFRMAGKHLIKNNILFVLITSLLFGFIHTANFLTIHIVGYFVFGVVMGIIYLKTKNIRIIIAAHFAGNFFGTALGFIMVFLL